jgi:beta-lactamase class D
MVQQKSGQYRFAWKDRHGRQLKTGVTTLGWYVGYVERAGKPYIFAANMVGGENPSGPKVKQIVLRILKSEKLLP